MKTVFVDTSGFYAVLDRNESGRWRADADRRERRPINTSADAFTPLHRDGEETSDGMVMTIDVYHEDPVLFTGMSPRAIRTDRESGLTIEPATLTIRSDPAARRAATTS